MYVDGPLLHTHTATGFEYRRPPAGLRYFPMVISVTTRLRRNAVGLKVSFMPKSDRHMLLWCDALNSDYTLSEKGKDWQRSFHSFEDAFEDAESRITSDTPLTLYNERGKVIIETTISPLSTELANSARHLPVESAVAD